MGIVSATNAVKTMNGFILFDKPIIVQYGRTKSTLVAKIDGTYDQKDVKTKGSTETTLNEKKSTTSTHTTSAKEHPPNKMLFVENIPPTSTAEMLTMLFQQLPVLLKYLWYQAAKELLLWISK